MATDAQSPEAASPSQSQPAGGSGGGSSGGSGGRKRKKPSKQQQQGADGPAPPPPPPAAAAPPAAPSDGGANAPDHGDVPPSPTAAVQPTPPSAALPPGAAPNGAPLQQSAAPPAPAAGSKPPQGAGAPDPAPAPAAAPAPAPAAAATRLPPPLAAFDGPPPTAFSIPHGKFFLMIQDKDLAEFHRLGGLGRIAAALQCDLGPPPFLNPRGIEESTVPQRVATYGENFIPDEEEITYLKFLQEALSDKMMILLLVLGVTALVINLTTPESGNDEVHYDKAWIDGTFIIVAVAVVVLVTTINDYLKELKFQALNAETSKLAFRVYRNGERVERDIKELVVGDLVEFSGGTAMPCDGIYVRGQGVSVDESACTGENDEKKKDHSLSVDEEPRKDPFLISGTSVVAAEGGLMLVIGVGENSFSGKLEMATRTGKVPTPLQEKLDDLADKVGRLGIVVAALLFVTLTIGSIAKAAHYGDKYDFKVLLDYAITAVAIIVVAVPEGLPLSVTIALAFSMGAMQKENNLVRSLAACETMGAATNICSDKTGTLTTNNMIQVKGNVGGKDLLVHDPSHPAHHHGQGKISRADVHPDISQKCLDTFLDAMCFCSSALLRPAKGKEKGDARGMVWEGNKTELGMLRWAERVAPNGIQSIRGSVAPADRLLYPFQSLKKSMTALIRREGRIVQYTKGASEIVLAHCNQWMDATGECRAMEPEQQAEFEQTIQRFAQMALRTIGFGMRIYSNNAQDPFPEEDPFGHAQNCVFLGISAIEDPVRKEVPPSVDLCFNAGVTVRMCTGDNLETAKAIALQCNILRTIPGVGPGIAMTGPDFRRQFVDDAANDYAHFRAMLPRVQVLARCSPLDKQLLVGMLMLSGEVVAVTGDGTNDAPALKLADVGFAMDDGTQVAKKASNIVLLDNNFVSVVTACKWGRNVNDSIRKFLQFQFTVNVVLLIVTFVGAVYDMSRRDGDGSAPLAPVHLLWANLIMDTMAALALSTEKPHADNAGPLMQRLPTYRSAPLIGRRMWRFVFGGAAFQLIVVMTLIFAGEDLFQCRDPLPRLNVTSAVGGNGTAPLDYAPAQKEDWEEDVKTLHRTVIFNVFIYMQVFNWFHARKLYDEINPFEGFDRSKLFLPIVLFTAGFQAFMVEVAQGFMETTKPGGLRWVAILGIAALMLPIGILVRFIPVEEAPVETEALVGTDGEDEEVSGKYEMIMKVQRMNHALFEGADAAPAPPPVRKPAWIIKAQRIVRVCRAFRGHRGPFVPTTPVRLSMGSTGSPPPPMSI
eukprot:TRINITY_DN714_c0_g2_i5.p1 TRINITY_DN714_c0_g2~~TRINITY_DN714_c0_g2_i5.p1  ORF type:complete len:1319 (+),score=396.72 TRINITY_DN714_c0_g2_i5:132-3959(+)